MTRRLGLIFTVLALVVQSLAVFQPPESANAASSNDFINGGVSSLNEWIRAYDRNQNNLRDIMTFAGFTKADIQGLKADTWTVKDKYSFGFEPRFSYAQGERKVIITDKNGDKVTTIYGRPNRLFNGYYGKVSGWSGRAANGTWFAIMKNCGNLVMSSIPTPPKITSTPTPTPTPTPVPKKCEYNPDLLASDERCQECPGRSGLWLYDTQCNAKIVREKEAVNVSQGSIDATTVKANANDVIKYTVTIKNTGLAPENVTMVEQLDDVLEYSELIDRGGASYDSQDRSLSWTGFKLDPGEKQTRVFAVRMLGTIPSTAQGASDPTSYDCVLTNVFGNQVDIAVNCPVEKVVETVATELPKTGPTENMIFAGSVLAVVTYFYARSRQLKREVRLIRNNLNTGAI